MTPGVWQPRLPTFDQALVPERIDAAFHSACRSMGVVLAGEPVRSYFTHSRGAMVRTPDGALRWLKVSGLHNGADPLPGGERSAAAFRGIPKPAVLEIREWTEPDSRWCAILMTLAAASARPQPMFSRRRHAISDGWIGKLKRALDTISGIPTERTRYGASGIAASVTTRFGTGAPHAAAEWRTAHGDPNWSNLTAPDLLLLDWGLWGLAPRGFDAAWLIAYTSPDAALTRRPLAAFAADLETSSGKVAQLVACSDLLGLVEAGNLDPRFHAPIESLARRALERT